jgi:hypothetical protein
MRAAAPTVTSEPTIRRAGVGLLQVHIRLTSFRASVRIKYANPAVVSPSTSICRTAADILNRSEASRACANAPICFWKESQPVANMRGTLVTVINRRYRSRGTVTRIYAANTPFTHPFMAGSFRPFHQGIGSTVRKNAGICEKKSGMPVRSASAQYPSRRTNGKL